MCKIDKSLFNRPRNYTFFELYSEKSGKEEKWVSK